MTDENSQQRRREQERSAVAPSARAELPSGAAPANGLSGRLIHTHGKFLRIEAVLASPGTIRFTAPSGQGGDYERSGTWTRRKS